MFSALRLLHLSSVTLFLRKNIAFSAHFVVRPTALRQIIFNSEKSLNMAQRSITSFFAKSNGAAPIAETKKTGEDAVNLKPGKRERSLTGDSESPKAKVEKIKNSPKAKTAPKKTPKKKSVTEDTEKVTSNEDIAKKTPKKTPKKKSVTEDTKKVTSNGDITKIAPKKMPKKKSVTEDTKKVTSNEDIEMKSCNTTTLSSEVKENVPEDIKTELKTEPSTINDEEKSPSNSSKGEKRKSSDKAKKSPTQKKEAIVEAKTETEPIADVDESTTDPNFKLEFSDEDSPIKVTKKPRKSRVSSSSSDDSPSPRKSPTKSDSKPSQVHSFFSKKTPESKKSETANADAKSDDTATKDKPAQKNWLLDSNESSAKDVGAVYTPSKSQYHPVNDACWTKGEPVPYLALARTLEEIENTSARLKIVDILANFLRSVIVLTPEDLVPAVYLCLNKVAPAYESVELGVAETYLMKAIAQSTGRKLGQVKTLVEGAGDLGLAAEKARGAQMVMHRPPPLTLQAIIKGLREITKMTGNASMTKKINKIQTMFVACRHSEARYFIRSLAGKLRIGLAEQSVLQALAQAASLTPPNQDILNASKGMSPESFKAIVDQNALIIKTTYCELPNYDIIIPTLLEHGVAALPDKCKLTPGVPLKPMLAHPTRGVNEIFQRFEGCNFTCEWKYDGERAQIHVPALDDKADLEGAKIFSRNQEDNTSKYPDVLSRLGSTLKDTVKSCVIDCEAVAWDMENEKILPFQILSTRKRKDANIADIKVNVCLFMFDLLYFNGKSLVAEPMEVRRQLLRDNFKEIKGEWLFATSRDCSTIDEVQEFLEESVKGSCEGLMVKTLSGKDATYQIAKRSKNWLKLKKDYLDGVGDTIDAVVIGGYKGRGKRAGVYGGFLLACYDPDTEEYQSLCKIGTGFSDEDLQNHADTLKQYITDGPRSYYRYDSSHSPDEWFSPSVVWEIRCADLSISPAHCAAIGHIQPDKGISLRFPRFLRIRDDKTPEGATSASQIARIYLSQDQVKNTAPSSKENADDDFY